jgi:ADP-heptose:LPS heptosyltransferase
MKILLVLYRTLGDCILGSTLVNEIVKKWPEAEITWAIHKEYVEIADTNPNVKGLIITDNHDVTLQEMASGRYDMIMVPAQTSHTDTCWHQRDKYKHGHLVDFYAQRCGLEITDRRTCMFPSEKDHNNVREKIASLGPEKDCRVVVHTQSLVGSKDWNQFGELVVELKRACEVNIVQVGGPNDTVCGADMDLRGKLTYNEIAALMEDSDLFIGVDSGLSYIADSVGCETICIMGMSTQETSGPISGRVTFIEPKRPEGCEWPCHSNCSKEGPCIQTISLEEVLNHAKEKLEQDGR